MEQTTPFGELKNKRYKLLAEMREFNMEAQWAKEDGYPDITILPQDFVVNEDTLYLESIAMKLGRYFETMKDAKKVIDDLQFTLVSYVIIHGLEDDFAFMVYEDFSKKVQIALAVPSVVSIKIGSGSPILEDAAPVYSYAMVFKDWTQEKLGDITKHTIYNCLNYDCPLQKYLGATHYKSYTTGELELRSLGFEQISREDAMKLKSMVVAIGKKEKSTVIDILVENIFKNTKLGVYAILLHGEDFSLNVDYVHKSKEEFARYLFENYALQSVDDTQ